MRESKVQVEVKIPCGFKRLRAGSAVKKGDLFVCFGLVSYKTHNWFVASRLDECEDVAVNEVVIRRVKRKRLRARGTE